MQVKLHWFRSLLTLKKTLSRIQSILQNHVHRLTVAKSMSRNCSSGKHVLKSAKDASFQALSPLDYEQNKLGETQPLSTRGLYAESCESVLISAALLNLATKLGTQAVCKFLPSRVAGRKTLEIRLLKNMSTIPSSPTIGFKMTLNSNKSSDMISAFK